MKAHLTTLLFLACVFPVVLAGLWQQTAVFPKRSGKDYLKLVPLQNKSLRALTLCMRLASEDLDRNVILFSYAVQNSANEMHMWREYDGRYSFYFRDAVVYFNLPTLDALMRQLCVTWDSTTGQTAFWMNGRQTLKKVLAQGHTVPAPEVVLIGQDQDSLEGSFEEKQCFVGAQTDVHLWDYVLSADEIKAINQGCSRLGGNILNWDRGNYVIWGNVQLKSASD